ncbi:MAG: tetratricopeptide repeat protein, partial [Chloroflexi bacterium]|nr:tetratricopeptide repeat protein [Chloroflexota bacterium]
ARLALALPASERLDFAREVAARHLRPALAARLAARLSLIAKDGPAAVRAPAAPGGKDSRPLCHQAGEVAAELASAELQTLAGALDPARKRLEAVWTRTNRLLAGVTAEIGRLSLLADDPVSALAAYQEAVKAAPERPDLAACLAGALTRLDRPNEALAALPPDCDDPLFHLAAARALHRCCQPVEALTHARAAATPALRSSHTPVEALREIAALLADGGDLPAALELAGEAVRRAPQVEDPRQGKVITLAELAGYHLRTGAVREAQAAGAGAVLLGPASAPARVSLARALESGSREDLSASLVHWEAAVRLDPGNPAHRLALARAALGAGQPALAESAARALLASGVEAAVGEVGGAAHAILGQLCTDQGDDEAASRHFSLATRLAPALREPWQALAAHYCNKGQRDQAVTTLEVGCEAALAAAAPATAAHLHSSLAELHQQDGRTDQAQAALEAALELQPEQAELHARLGALLQGKDQSGLAARAFQRALELAPGSVGIAHRLALVLEAQGTPESASEATQILRPAVAASFGDPHADLSLFEDFGRLSLAIALQPGRPAGQSGALSTAIKAFREVLRRDPARKEVLAQLGAAQEASGDHAAALASYQGAIKLGAGSERQLNRGIGRCCLKLGKLDTAIAALREAVAACPEPKAPYGQPCAETLAELGAAYSQAQMKAEALEAFQRAVAAAPEDPDVLAGLARTAREAGEFSLAQESYQRVLHSIPAPSGPRFSPVRLARAGPLADLADLRLAAGDTAGARAGYAEALSVLGAELGEAGPAGAPAGADVPRRTAKAAAIYRRAAEAQFELGETAEAAGLLRAASALTPHDPRLHARLGEALARIGDCGAAHDAYLRAAETEPADQPSRRAAHLCRAGEARWEQAQAQAALALWRSALRLNPEDARTHSRLGKALLGHDDAAALSELELACRYAPEDLEAARDAARAAIALGDVEQAQNFLARVTRLLPGDARAQAALGEVLLIRGQAQPALTAYRQAARLAPGEPAHAIGQARALVQIGELVEAARLARAVLLSEAATPQVRGAAGEVLLEAGDLAEGLAALQATAAAQPDNVSAQLVLARALVSAGEIAAGELPGVRVSGVRVSGVGVSGTTFPPDTSSPDTSSPRSVAALLEGATALNADPATVQELTARARALWADPGAALPLLEEALRARPDAERGDGSGLPARRAAIPRAGGDQRRARPRPGASRRAGAVGAAAHGAERGAGRGRRFAARNGAALHPARSAGAAGAGAGGKRQPARSGRRVERRPCTLPGPRRLAPASGPPAPRPARRAGRAGASAARRGAGPRARRLAGRAGGGARSRRRPAGGRAGLSARRRPLARRSSVTHGPGPGVAEIGAGAAGGCLLRAGTEHPAGAAPGPHRRRPRCFTCGGTARSPRQPAGRPAPVPGRPRGAGLSGRSGSRPRRHRERLAGLRPRRPSLAGPHPAGAGPRTAAAGPGQGRPGSG